MEKVSKITDCYLVWGNHDYNITDAQREKMAECCTENGITVLENEYTVVERDGDKMLLVGTVSGTDSSFVQAMLEDYPNEKCLRSGFIIILRIFMILRLYLRKLEVRQTFCLPDTLTEDLSDFLPETSGYMRRGRVFP